MMLGWKIKQFLQYCDDLHFVTDYSVHLINEKKLLNQAVPLITEMEKACCNTNVHCETSDDEEDFF